MNYRSCTKLCTFERNPGTDDDFTGTVADWEEIGSGFCKIEPVSGQEISESDQMSAQLTHRITTRYQPIGLAARDRVTYGSRTFNLTSVVNVMEENKWLEAMAVERT